jgi:hypothetical protein
MRRGARAIAGGGRTGRHFGAAVAMVVVTALLPGTGMAAAGQRATTASSPSPDAVFYSGEGSAGIKQARPYAGTTLKAADWTAGSCRTSNAIPPGLKAVSTAAGYSLGRLGPVYYLKEARDSAHRLDRLRYILLFDPGAFGEFQDSCDANSRIDPDRTLASWLGRNRDNRLIIVTGRASLDLKTGSLYLGLRSFYLPAIVAKGMGGQTLICNAESNGVPYDHEDVMKAFAPMIAGAAPAACPRGLYGWHAGERPYANRIVQWNADPKAQKTSWFVGDDGKRRWIPDAATFECLQQKVGGSRPLTASILERLPDLTGQRATCEQRQDLPPPAQPAVTLGQGPSAPAGYRYAVTVSGLVANSAVEVVCRDSVDPGGFFTFALTTDANGGGYTESQCYSGDGPDHWVTAGGVESNHVSWGGSPSPPVEPPPPATTWSEQQGSLGANTFTNPYNASGMGQKIAPYQWVEVSCKVYAPQITSANPDGYWYRIASAPWSNAYYAVANTFWNGDVPGVKPYTHNTDFVVPNC